MQHGQIVPPIVESGATIIAPVDVARMLGDDVTLGDDNEAIRIDPQTHGLVGVGSGDAIAVTFEGDQACRGKRAWCVSQSHRTAGQQASEMGVPRTISARCSGHMPDGASVAAA